ncbi:MULTISPECIES: transposase [Streptomyces]|uniref:transposase n=1 Tax=Streptomyces TaxID=1883 RepID=UPI00202A0C81|nr:transposase [Streptomyces sp. CJ_13]
MPEPLPPTDRSRGVPGARLEPPSPRGRKPGRPPTWTRRRLIDGIRFRTRTGVPWRDVIEGNGPWGSSRC